MQSTPSQRVRILGPWVVIAVALVMVLLSYFFSINEYVSVFGAEMAGAYDCDGPAGVLTLAAAGIVCSLLGTVWAIRAPGTRGARVALGVAVIVVIAATIRILPAIDEVRRNATADSPCH